MDLEVEVVAMVAEDSKLNQKKGGYIIHIDNCDDEEYTVVH